MNGFGKYYDGKVPLSRRVSWHIENEAISLIEEDSGGHLGSWSFSEIEQDRDQNVVLVFVRRATGEKIELEGQPNGFPDYLIKHPNFFFNPKMLVGLLSSIFILLICIWQMMPFITRAAVTYFPEEQEKKVAQFLEIDRYPGIQKCTPSAASELAWKKLLNRIVPDYQLDIVISKGGIENAFTLPGGHIVIFSELIKHLSSPEELAGIVAHEIGHVKNRHVMQKIVQALSFTVVFQFIGGDFSSVYALDPSTVLGIASLSFDRNMEAEADKYSFDLLDSKEVNPNETARFFERQLRTSEKYAFFTTHPADAKRIEFFKRKTGKKYEPILFDNEWKALQKYCGDDK